MTKPKSADSKFLQHARFLSRAVFQHGCFSNVSASGKGFRKCVFWRQRRDAGLSAGFWTIPFSSSLEYTEGKRLPGGTAFQAMRRAFGGKLSSKPQRWNGRYFFPAFRP